MGQIHTVCEAKQLEDVLSKRRENATLSTDPLPAGACQNRIADTERVQ